MAKKKKTTEKKARVHKDLEGFEIKINPLGEITSNFDIDQINKFLDKNVYDKKLVNKDDEEEEFLVQDQEENEENEDDFLKNIDDEEKENLPPKPKGKK
ncbi:MAG: hypothetical protein JWQ14_1783 [Adhaeribacter sp.]|jgi:hypothetical protein|nr:hypothetical protein [Adhaeribacter sp.]